MVRTLCHFIPTKHHALVVVSKTMGGCLNSIVLLLVLYFFQASQVQYFCDLGDKKLTGHIRERMTDRMGQVSDFFVCVCLFVWYL